MNEVVNKEHNSVEGCGDCPACRAKEGEFGYAVIGFKDGQRVGYDVENYSQAMKAGVYLYHQGAEDVTIMVFLPHPEKAAQRMVEKIRESSAAGKAALAKTGETTKKDIDPEIEQAMVEARYAVKK